MAPGARAPAMAPEEAYESTLHFPCPEGARHATDAERQDFRECQGCDNDGYFEGGWDEFNLNSFRLVWFPSASLVY